MAQGTRIRAHFAVVAAPTEGTWTFTASVPTPSGGAQHQITNATFSFWRHRPAERANVAVWVKPAV